MVVINYYNQNRYYIKLNNLIELKITKMKIYKQTQTFYLYKEILDLKRQIDSLKTKLKKNGKSKLKYEIKE
jgi:hypothetical protein